MIFAYHSFLKSMYLEVTLISQFNPCEPLSTVFRPLSMVWHSFSRVRNIPVGAGERELSQCGQKSKRAPRYQQTWRNTKLLVFFLTSSWLQFIWLNLGLPGLLFPQLWIMLFGIFATNRQNIQGSRNSCSDYVADINLQSLCRCCWTRRSKNFGTSL